ncbi:MAG TPA: protein kinase [Phycisphaerae bacterium]|nr:protein kinase [Phycisphaerae bacterium]
MSEPAPTSAPGGQRPEPTTPAPTSVPTAPSDVLPTPADLFPGYEIIAEISRGGQGIVYQAIQTATKRKVALKVLLHGHYADSAQRKRFQREIETLAQLRHPNIVSIFDADLTKDGRQFYVMDYVRGKRLDAYVQTQRASVEQMAQLFIGICDAMHHAHEHGFVHRDLKPQNILVDSDGHTHILDFGLARPMAAGVDPQLSTSLHVMGTLRYLSPEQAGRDPGAIDRRTDIYSLGVILYTLLTGATPYDTDSDLHSALDNILHAAPKRPSTVCAGIDPDLETIILTCLSKERERRYQTATALAGDLRAFLAGAAITARQDSRGYLVRKHAQRAVARHPITTHLGIIVVATLLARPVGDYLFFGLTPVGGWVDRFIIGRFAVPPAGPALQQVRIITMTDSTGMPALAKQESLADVSRDNRQSYRRLHGRLMERLAQAGVRAVAFDITFMGNSPFDEDFVSGVRALRAAGAEVIVTVTDWPLQGLSSAQLSGIIAPDVRWGRPVLAKEAPWRLVLFMQRGVTEPMPSMALTTFAACRQPDAEPVFRVNEARESLEIIYYKADPNVPRSKQLLESSDHINLTYLTPVPTDVSKMGLKSGDYVGHFIIPMPNDDVLTASTIDYREIFSAALHDLKDMLRDKVVVIGDLTSKDWYPHPDGRTLPGCHAHAVGIDMLLRSISLGRPRWEAKIAMTLGAALLGCLIVAFAAGRRWKTYLLVAAAAAASFGASLIIVRLASTAWNPLLAILAMFMACEMSLWIGRRNKLDRQTVQ